MRRQKLITSWAAMLFLAAASTFATGCFEDDDGPTDEDSSVDDVDSGVDDGDSGGGDQDAGTEDSGGGDEDASTSAPVAPAAAGDIVITEIQAAPVGYADDSLAEWIEVHNPSTTVTYDLGGCTWGDKAGDEDYTFDADTLLAPGAYLVFSSTTFTEVSNGFVSDGVYGADGTGLSGSGDAPNISCGGTVIDAVNYAAEGFPIPESAQGHTIQLDPTHLSGTDNDTGANWCYSATLFFTSNGEDNFGSPHAANESCTREAVTPTAAGDVVITEIQAAPVGYADDNLAEWVEVYNPSVTATYDLGGCTFADKPADEDYTITAGTLVPPGGYIVLSSAVFTELLNGFVSDDVYGTSSGLSATSDGPTIRCSGTVIDTVAYSMAGGFLLPSASEGHTLQLDPTHLDATENDAGANWCFSTVVFFTSAMEDNFGSPRAANASCTP